MITAIDAIVLAGEKEGSIPVMGMNKALLPVEGKPLVGHVVSALDRAKHVKSITMVGPADKLREALAAMPLEKPLNFIEQGANIFENMWEGALSTCPGYRRGCSLDEVEADHDRAVMCLTCDMPLLRPEEVDHFISTMPLDRADLIYGVTPRRLLEPYEPNGQDPGIKFIYACFKGHTVRHSNIFAFRPAKLAHVMQEYIPLIYSIRYQRHLKNVLQGLLAVLKFSLAPGAVYSFSMIEAATWCHSHGHEGLCELFRNRISREYGEKIASRALQTRFAIHETLGPGATLDIDDEQSYLAFQKMLPRWREIQERQILASQ